MGRQKRRALPFLVGPLHRQRPAGLIAAERAAPNGYPKPDSITQFPPGECRGSKPFPWRPLSSVRPLFPVRITRTKLAIDIPLFVSTNEIVSNGADGAQS